MKDFLEEVRTLPKSAFSVPVPLICSPLSLCPHLFHCPSFLLQPRWPLAGPQTQKTTASHRTFAPADPPAWSTSYHIPTGSFLHLLQMAAQLCLPCTLPLKQLPSDLQFPALVIFPQIALSPPDLTRNILFAWV